MPITEKRYADPKVVALALFGRTVSNFKSALILLDSRRVIEARILTRCCLENSFWVARLAVDGEKFHREMMNDMMSHRQRRGQRLFGPDMFLDDATKERLAASMRDMKKRFPNATTLNPSSVASETVLARSYIFYEQLSADAAHPGLDALNRHVIPDTVDEVGGIDIDPLPKERELAETFEYLCAATFGVFAGVNDIIKAIEGGDTVGSLFDRYIALSTRANAVRRVARHLSEADAPAVG